MLKHSIPFEFRRLNFVDNKEEAAILAKESPINKVPILVADGQKIFDSRVIVNFLHQKHGLQPLSLEEENIVSAIYSCMDVSVTLFLMKHDGYDIEKDSPYLNRQRERIPRNLEFVKSWAMELDAKNPAHWSYPSMSLFSFLYWGDVRARTIRLKELPEFQSFLERFSGAPGVKESSFAP